MSLRTQPTIISISTPGTPAPPAQNIVSHPLVRRRVKHAAGLDWCGHHYDQGCIVTMASNLAFTLEQSGHLERGEPS